MIKINESKELANYKEKLKEAVNYYWNRDYVCDIPVKRGTSIFAYQEREFDMLDYWRGKCYL